jgi:DHA3 family tetracycline resistance protein-like MFS transporter
MALKILAPLRVPAFRTLWTGMSVSLIGDGVTLVAIAWQVYQLSGAPAALGVTLMAMSIPNVILLLFGGVVSDRFDRRRVMMASDLVRGAAVLALGVLALAGSPKIWHLAVIAACYGAGNAFFTPAFDALVPDLVPAPLLAQANSLDQFVRPLAARLIGPALGGWVIGAIGVGWGFVADAASFAVSIACLIRLGALAGSAPAQEPAREALQNTGSIRAEIAEGFAFVRGRPWLWGTFAAATLSYLIFLGPAEVLLPYIVKNEMGGTAADLGLVFAMGGLGAITASVIVAQRDAPARNMTFIYAAWSLSTLAVAGYGLARAPWQAMLACFAFNAFESAGLILWLTTKQTNVPARLFGRVSSLEGLIATGLMPVSYALSGSIGSALGSRTTLIAAGLVGAAVNTAFYFLPGVRSVERVPTRASGTAVQHPVPG